MAIDTVGMESIRLLVSTAATTGAADSIMVAGPAVLSGLEHARSAIQTALGHPMTPEQVSSFVAEETAKWRNVVQTTGVKVE